MTEPGTPGKGADGMSSRLRAERPRNGNTPAPAEVAAFERVSHIRAFRVRDWARLASELRMPVGHPAVSISRRRGQRLAS